MALLVFDQFFILNFFFNRVIYSTTYEGPEILGVYPAYQIFNYFLYVLQVMHIVWFYMILRVAYKAIVLGKVDKDDRSESDDDDNDNEAANQKQKKK